ncbi:hypothetical protein WJX75_004084 [Coccomyxa subellipsoidea]|uniref:VASt domain-containing protein n=1 Tax=Coccomyxa subellipsoidea TaxID=248742 RepID=A0ABR2YVX1_9CHLO
MVKTFFTSVNIPGITALDYHIAGGTSEIFAEFQRRYNKDANASCTPWEPLTFASAPDGTKHRTAQFASQMKAPGWLRKLIGRPTLPILDYQRTTLNKETGNLTFDSAPIIQHGPNGPFSIAQLHWDVFNRVGSDGQPFITIDVTMTAMADYAWMWGVQTAVEAIFISQAKDDIAAYLQSNIDFFRDLVAAGKVPSQNGITSDDHLGMPASAPVAPAVLRSLPNGSHAAANGNMPKHLGKGALYTNDSVSVYYDASEKLRKPARRSVDSVRPAVPMPLPKVELEKQQRNPVLSPRQPSPKPATRSALSPRGAGVQVNAAFSPRTPAKTASILKGAKSPRSSQRQIAPQPRDKVRRMCQEWADESIPMQHKSARGRAENNRPADPYEAMSPRSRERERIRVTTPATPRQAPKPPVVDGPPAVKKIPAKAAAEAAEDPVEDLGSDVLSRVATTPKPAADPRAVRVLPSHSPTPAQRAARHTLTRHSATTAMRRNSELIADDLGDPGPGMAAVALLPPQKSVSAPITPRSNRGLSPRPHSGGQRWADDSNSFKYQKKRPQQPSRLGTGVRFQPGATVEYGDSRWPGHIVAIEDSGAPMSPRTPFPASKRVGLMHGQEPRIGLSPRPALKTSSKTPGASNLQAVTGLKAQHETAMVRRKELPAIFMPWSVAQIHSVLADSDYLAMFHKESHGSFSMEVEPWDPPGSGSAFVWKRRCLFTAPLQGPPWFKTMLGGPQLVDMMDTQEMMYDPESGCMMVQVDSYMLLDGGATTMRMRHMKWLYRPVKAEDLTGCEVKATLTTCGASFRNAQLQDLPKQVEDALATIATEEATEFNNFALCYIGALQEAGQLPTPEQALSKLMDTSNGRPLFSGPKTPGKLADMPFNLVSGVLVYKDKDAPQYMDLPAGHHGANTISPTENSDNSTPVDMQGAADLQQRDMGSAPPVTGERLSMTDSVLEGIPAGGKEVDKFLGTKLNSLDLATAGRSLRIRTWRSRAHDSGMSMRPAYDQRSSDDSQRTQSIVPKCASSDSQPRGPDKSSITAEERALLERLTHEHNGKEGGPRLNPKERRMVDEILDASMEADQLTAGMEPEAGRDMHLNSSYRKDHQHDGAETTPATGPEPARGEWAELGEYDQALSGSVVDSLRSSSEYSVSTIGTPHRFAGVPNAVEQAPGAADDQDLELMDTSISERSFKPQNKTHQNGAAHTATTTIVETMFWDAEEDFDDDGTTLNAKLLKALDDAEKHDMHTPEAGVLHTSGSFHIPPTDASDTAVAMATVMSVAIETVNAVAETAMNTVNHITRVSLEHLQSVGHTSSLASYRSIPVPYNSAYQGPWEDKMPLSRQHSLATSADARSFRAPTANQNFRQAGIGRRGAGSAPIFHRGGNGPPRGPLSFQADIAHPKAAGDTRQRSLAPSARREEARFEPARLGDAHESAPPFAGRKRVKVPPLWTGSSPFEGRLSDTMDSEALSEAQEGMQWVNGKGWVEAERTFLRSFNSAPPLLRRNDSQPSTAPDMAPASRRPSPVPEHRVVFTAQSVEAVPIPAGQDTNAVVQRATREHLMAERRRRAAKLATRGVPPGATDSLPPPRDLPDRRLPTSATKADAAARRRSKGGLCGKLSKMCAAMYACRKSKGARTNSYTEPSRPQVSDQAS